MKKSCLMLSSVLAVCITAAVALCAYYDFETDCQFGITNPIAAQYVAKSKDGYFVLNESGYVYFLDAASGSATYLCNKPNCLHTDNSCYAHIFVCGNFNIIRCRQHNHLRNLFGVR